MRKLNILKAIVDFVCIMSYITIPVLIIFLGYIIISDEPLGMPININGVEVNVIDFKTKILLSLLIISGILILYCLFLFKKVLALFQKRKIFELDVIKKFNLIGILLLISALLSGIPAFIIKLLNKKLSLEMGLNPFILLFSLGLFFMVLSEVFTIAKKQKEENELTI